MGWKECQAVADVIRVAERGTKINNASFVAVFDQLRQKYGAVNGPLVENGRLVALILPGPGDVRIKTGDVISGVSFSFDGDGDVVLTAKTYKGKSFTVCLQLAGRKKEMMVLECKAFIEVLGMLETGDRVDELTFVAFLGTLRTKYNFVKLGKSGGMLIGSVLPSRVRNTQPIDSIMVKAMEAKGTEQPRSAGSASGGGANVPPCPYKGMTYTRVLQESGQAQVYAGVAEDGMKVAIKVFKGDEEDATETYRTELRMLLKMKEHRNVIQCLEFFENPKPALVMRLIEGMVSHLCLTHFVVPMTICEGVLTCL